MEQRTEGMDFTQEELWVEAQKLMTQKLCSKWRVSLQPCNLFGFYVAPWKKLYHKKENEVLKKGSWIAGQFVDRVVNLYSGQVLFLTPEGGKLKLQFK